MGIDGKEQGCVRSANPVIKGASYSGKYKENTLVILLACDLITGFRVIFYHFSINIFFVGDATLVMMWNGPSMRRPARGFPRTRWRGAY